MSDDWLWLFEVKCVSSTRSCQHLAPVPKAISVFVGSSELTSASIGLCVNRGAADGKLVLIHDVQSYIYTSASPVAVVLASVEPMVAC